MSQLATARTQKGSWGRIWSDVGPAGRASLVAVALLLFAASFGPAINPRSGYDIDPRNRFAPPSWEHWMGTDEVGRDLFSRVLLGTRISLMVAGTSLLIAVSVGLILGTVSGYVGGAVDELIMRITDLFLSVPTFILALVIASTLGPGTWNAAIAIGIAWWPQYARLVRGQVLATKANDYVEAARALGAGSARIAVRHVLANSYSPIVIKMTLDVGTAILITAGLSFIGLGSQPPTPDWGTMIATARPYIFSAPWYPTIIGFAILVTVSAFTMAGDALQDVAP